jgi:hypothetical protein
MFYVKRLGPLELRERSGPLGWGLYGMEVWDKRIGKVLNTRMARSVTPNLLRLTSFGQ